MGNFVLPKVFRAGYTVADMDGIREYLEYTKQTDFMKSWEAARNEGLSEAECLMSLYAKLCYKSLVADGRNVNIKRTRDIPDNLRSVIQTAHGSVFEHASMNFIVTDCSRVYTHEQVRHRAGAAFSQTSGRYCRLDSIDLVFDPVLEPARDLWHTALHTIEDTVYLTECRLGLRKPPAAFPTALPTTCLRRNTHDEALADELLGAQAIDTLVQRGFVNLCEAGDTPDDDVLRWVPDDTFDFAKRKQITSAIRRIAPNGQSNEMGLTLNVRALRHTLLLRTARHAEWEIRLIFGQIYSLVKTKFPLMFADAHEEQVDGLLEVSGMKMQPYELDAGHPDALKFYEVSALEAEIARRNAA